MADPVLMTADDPSVSQTANTGGYGLYFGVGSDNQGDLVLEPTSFISYSYSNDSRISQYPQEDGAFQQYNKVDTPFDVRIRVTKSGNVATVSAFIQVAEALAKATDLNLYDMISPERTYHNCNVYRVTHDHQAHHGASMVTMDISLIEIRESVAASYTTSVPTVPITAPKVPANADPKQDGTVQPAIPTATQQTAVYGTLANVLQNEETIVP